MTIYLSSMPWPCTGSIWKVKDVILKSRSYGTMVVLHNSKVHEHGICCHVSSIYGLWAKAWRGANVLEFFCIWPWEGRGWWCMCALESGDLQGTNQTTCNEATKCTQCCHFLLAINKYCHNLSFGLATKARVYKGAGQEWAQESHFMLPGVQESVREWTPTLPSELSLWKLESQWTPKSSEGNCKGQNSLNWNFTYIIGNLLELRCLK